MDDLEDLSGLCVSAQLSLGKHQFTIQGNLVHPTRRLDELDVGVGVCLLNLGRQTGSPWTVASNATELDGNLHIVLLIREITPKLT